MRKYLALVLLLVCVLGLVGCGQQQEISERSAYTYEELSEMPAEELLDIFIENGLVISDELKASFTEEELQTLFKQQFPIWHTGLSVHSYTAYSDLARQTKAIYDKIAQ